MNPVNVFVHRVASVAEVRALESIGVRMLGVSLLQNTDLPDGRSLAVPEAAHVLTAVRSAQVVVECDPDQAFELPEALRRGTFLWSPYQANTLLLRKASEQGYNVIVGPVSLNGFFDLRPGPPVVPELAYEYQVRGGEPGALEDALTKPGIYNKVREGAEEHRVYVGFDVAPKTASVALKALGPAWHMLTLGHPRVPPAGRHHQGLFRLFDTLAALGLPALSDTELSPLEVADIELRQQGALQFAKADGHANGKEPFDLQKFSTFYDLSHDVTAGYPLETQIARWEERYYLQSKHVKTLAEFADYYRMVETYR